jgi:uncharacterized protein (TIGR02265 family)
MLDDFSEPNWNAPLDPEPEINAIPESATVAGMYLNPVAKAATQIGRRLPSARDNYPAFKFFPMREHVRLLVEACSVVYPDLTLRRGLRKLGRGAPGALLQSTLGRVTVGSAMGVVNVLTAMCKTYPVNLPSCRVEVVESSDGHLIASFRNIYYFLDSHHVGVLEGGLRHAGKKGQVLVKMIGPHSADMLCRWT